MEDQHKTAVETLAAERYMLGQMTDAERESFEEHYFNCRHCIEDVKAIDVIATAAKQPKVEPVRKGRSMTVVPWAIAASLAGALTLQPLLMRTPVVQFAEVPYVSEVTLASETRAAGKVTKLPAEKRVLQYVEIVHEPQYSQYRWEVRGDAKALASNTVTPEQTNEPIPLLLGPLPAGSYELVIEGVREDGNRSPIATHVLVVGGS